MKIVSPRMCTEQLEDEINACMLVLALLTDFYPKVGMLSEMNWLGGPWLQDCCCTWQILSVQYYCTSLPVQTRLLLIHSILPLLLSVSIFFCSGSKSVCRDVEQLGWCQFVQPTFGPEAVQDPSVYANLGLQDLLGILSHFEHLVHAGPRAATTPLLSVVLEPVGVSFNLAIPGCCWLQLYTCPGPLCRGPLTNTICFTVWK